MKKIIVSQIDEKSIAALDVYNGTGTILIKKDAIIGIRAKTSLIAAGINSIYIKDEFTIVNRIFNLNSIIEILKLLYFFTSSDGENGTILKHYNKEEIRRFFGKGNEAGNKIVYGQIFKILSMSMAESIIKSKKIIYDYLDFRNVETYNCFHPANSAVIAAVIGCNMGLKVEEISDIITGTLLCDVKMKLYPFVQGKNILTQQEIEEIRQHACLSYDMIRNIYGVPSRAALICLQHHERINKSGYPGRLTGKEISLFSKITAVADVYDSMLSVRSFRDAFTPQEAWEYIDNNKNVLFDGDVVDEFKRAIPKFMPGDLVELSDGTSGNIVENRYGHAEYPSIKLIEKKGKSVIISCGDRSRFIIKTLETIRQKEQ